MADAQALTLGFPDYMLGLTPAFNVFAVAASTSAQEWIFQAKEAATLTRLGVRLGTITGTTPTYQISLQGVDSSGNPDGTVKGGGSPASVSFSPSGLGWSASTWHWLTLDNSYVCTRGEYLAVVVSYVSGTVDGSNNATFTSDMTTISSGFFGFPYAIQNTAGTRARRSAIPIFGYGSAGTAYGFPLQTINTHLYNSSSAPNEYAAKVTLPSGWSQTGKLRGVRFNCLPVAAGTLTPTLYDGGAAANVTVLQSVAHDSDAASAASMRALNILFTNSTLSTLVFGNSYRVGFVPGAANITLVSLDVAAAADWDAWPMGQNMSYSTRTSAGNWTDTTTRRLLCNLVMDDLTQSSGTRRVFH
jgi:hypothetical protein